MATLLRLHAEGNIVTFGGLEAVIGRLDLVDVTVRVSNETATKRSECFLFHASGATDFNTGKY